MELRHDKRSINVDAIAISGKGPIKRGELALLWKKKPSEGIILKINNDNEYIYVNIAQFWDV